MSKVKIFISQGMNGKSEEKIMLERKMLIKKIERYFKHVNEIDLVNMESLHIEN